MIEVLAARHLFGIDVAGAWHPANHIGDASRGLFEHRQIVAEHLHADLGPDAGRQHVDPIDDRHRPDVRDARQLNRRAHVCAQAIEGHARPPLLPGLQVHDGFGHVQRRRIGGRVRARDLGDDVRDLGKRHEDRVLPLRDLRVLFQRDARIGDRHEHQVAFVERRHELAADPSCHEQRARKQQRGSEHGQAAMRQGGLERRPVEPTQHSHDGVVFLGVERAAKEQRAEHRHQGDRDDRGREHGKGLGERQRVKQLALLSGQGKDRDERQQDDRHREEHRAADQPRRLEHGLPHALAIARIDLPLLDEAERVLGDDDAGVDEDADGDGDAGEAHDVRRDAGVVHPEEGAEHGQRQRNRDDQNRPEVHQEDDVRQRDQEDFFDQRAPQRVRGLLDQLRAVVERDDPDVRREGPAGSARCAP